MEQKTFAVADNELDIKARHHRDIEKRLGEQIDRLKKQLSDIQNTHSDHRSKATESEKSRYFDWAFAEVAKKGITKDTVVEYSGVTSCLTNMRYSCYPDSHRVCDEYVPTMRVVIDAARVDHPIGYWHVRQDDNEVVYCSITMPRNVTDLPAELSYPSRKQITALLKSADIRVNDEYGFDSTWEYKNQMYTGGGKTSAESLVNQLKYDLTDTSELRKVAWHRARCSRLAERLKEKGMLADFEYKPIMQQRFTGYVNNEDGTRTESYKEELVRYRGLFTFNMTKQGVK